MPRRRVRFTKFFHSSVLLLFFHSSVYLAGLIFTSGLLVMLPVSHGFIPGLRVIPLIALLVSSTEKMFINLDIILISIHICIYIFNIKKEFNVNRNLFLPRSFSVSFPRAGSEPDAGLSKRLFCKNNGNTKSEQYCRCKGRR